MADFNVLWNAVLKSEGGYENQTSDVGNYCDSKLVGTKYGVSAVNYKEYYGICPTSSQMKNLTVSEAKAIWKKTVWDKIKGDQIKSIGEASLILDAAGGGKSGYLHTRQSINNVAGKKLVTESSSMAFTNNEIDSLNSLNEKSFIDEFYKTRLSYFQNHSQYDIYGKGWINRLERTYSFAKSKIMQFAYTNPKTSIAIVVGIVAVSVYGFFYLKKVLK